MRKYLSFLMLATILAIGCSKDNSSTSVNDSETFTFNEGTYLTPTIDSEGGVLTFGFKSSTSWSVIEDAEWVEVTPASGDATAEAFDVEIAKNTFSDVRVATLTVAYGKKSIDIILTQLGDQNAVNEITYRTTDNQPLALDSYEGFGSTFVENIYADGYGKMRFEEDITAIPANAFKGCSTLSLIILPDNIKSIGESAFEGCTALNTILINNDLAEIGERAFYECRSLKSVDLGEGLSSIGAEAFYLCAQLEGVAIPAGVKNLGNSAFYNCISLAEVTLAEGVESIGDHCFALCSTLTTVALPDSVTTVGDYAFSDCEALATATLGGGIKSIGNNAFAGCSELSNISLPEGLQSLGNYSFSNCKKVHSLTIPASVESIGNCAFFNCTALYSIESLATTAPALGKYAFHKYKRDNTHDSGEAGNIDEVTYTPIGAIIYVPAEAIEIYKSADNWSDYATSIRAK